MTDHNHVTERKLAAWISALFLQGYFISLLMLLMNKILFVLFEVLSLEMAFTIEKHRAV